MNPSIKKQNGVFYTSLYNPFKHERFTAWAKEVQIQNKTILEPFAGANHIIQALQDIDMCDSFASFDIDPKDEGVSKQDTIFNFPQNYSLCITNPPWLYKSRAKRLKLQYPDTKWDNLYKHCLELCLKNCDYVAILIPASFLSSNIFLDRLDSVIVLQRKLFDDTENPVCLALFNKDEAKDTDIFIDDKEVGKLSEIKKLMPKQKNSGITFNVKDGDLGLIAIDNTKTPSIRFCNGLELGGYDIKTSSRSITRISIDGIRIQETLISKLNDELGKLRENTYDIFMTAFKGVRADGYYRRRLDFSLARKIISENI